MKQKGQIRIYACGGGGINVGSHFERYRQTNEPAFATVEPVYIDTSDSNIGRNRASIDKSNCYLIEGLDGSGKIRSENHETISDRTRDILQQFKPLDLNIVLSTAAGGSGSVIAPSLVSELLDRDQNVIVLMIGSTDTRIDAENTLKTLKSYEAISRLRSAPVVAAYIENSQSLKRTDADLYLQMIVFKMCVLFSRQNHELDSRDLFNWLRYERVTTFKSQLAALTVIEAREITGELDSIGNIISVATIASDDMDIRIPIKPEYQCVGYLGEHNTETVKNHCPIHFVVSDGIFQDVGVRINQVLKEMSEVQHARITKRTLLDERDQPTGSGIVL